MCLASRVRGNQVCKTLGNGQGLGSMLEKRRISGNRCEEDPYPMLKRLAQPDYWRMGLGSKVVP